MLVTHQRQFLPMCDRVLVMRDGRVVALGTWAQLQGLPGLPEILISQAHAKDSLPSSPMHATAGIATGSKAPAISLTSDLGPAGDCGQDAAPDPTKTGEPPAAIEGPQESEIDGRSSKEGRETNAFVGKDGPADVGVSVIVRSQGEAAAGKLGVKVEAEGREAANEGGNGDAAKGTLVQAEGRQVGTVRLSVYGQYFRHAGIATTLTVLVTLFAGQVWKWRRQDAMWK